MIEGRTFVVTGGNAGIGKAIAMSLARKNAHVVIISRDALKGEKALEDIRSASAAGRVDLVIGDLGSIGEIRRLAVTLLERYPQIHVLINNAGVWMMTRTVNVDGLETTFVVNHMAPFMLSNLMLERLKASAPARIVNVNAALYVFGRLDLERTPYGRDFSRFRTYANTKLCNMLFTSELARRIKGSGVTINAVHPGVIRTNLGRSQGILGHFLSLTKRFLPPPEKGAEAPVWLATSPELGKVSGKYFNVTSESRMNKAARDVASAAKLWELSLNLAGMHSSP